MELVLVVGALLVGRTGWLALIVVEVVVVSGQLVLPHCWPFAQHPPPSDEGQEWKPDIHVEAEELTSVTVVVVTLPDPVITTVSVTVVTSAVVPYTVDVDPELVSVEIPTVLVAVGRVVVTVYVP